MNIKMFRRKAGVFGVAIASMFGAPLPMMKKSHEEEGDPGLRVVNEEGIISSQDIVQGQWAAYSSMDEHLYRYESMENLVSHDNCTDGKFWKTATFSTNGENVQVIHGTRSDGVVFSVERKFNINEKKYFDQLCQDFNKKLREEIA